MKSLKSNTVKSKNIVDLFKKVGEKCSTEKEPFAPPVITATLFNNKATIIKVQHHKDVVSNKLAFYSLSKWPTDVWKLLQKAAVTTTNYFVIKSLFEIAWLFI